MAATKRRTLYPAGHRQSDDPYYVDDTLDAYPPYHLLRGKPTPEAMAAARQLAAKRGYPPPQFGPDAPTAPAPEARLGRKVALAAEPTVDTPPEADR